MRPEQRVAVVGAGTAGLASAIALASQGHRITIFERFEKPRPVGAGILLQPSGLAALERLDGTLAKQINAVGSRVNVLDGRSHCGRRVMDVRYPDLTPELHALGLHRGQLFQILLRKAIASGVELQTGFSADRVSWTAQGQPILHQQCSATEAFDALVVADGTQSALRAQLLPKARCSVYPWGALWAICPATADSPRDRLAQCYHGAKVMIGLLPTGCHPADGQPCVSFFWSLPLAAMSAWRERSFARWQREVIDLWPACKSVVAALRQEDLAEARYADVVSNSWHNQRSVIIGDAGHGMSPQLGQGANLALIDAVILADCVQHTGSFEQAFAEYSRRRRSHLRFYQRASRWLTPLFQSRSRSGAWLRDRAFPLARRLPWSYRETLRCVAGIKTGNLFDRDLTLPVLKNRSEKPHVLKNRWNRGV